MRNKYQPLIIVALMIIGFVLFFYFGISAKRPGPSYTQNCTDVDNQYEPCLLHNVKYGIPFTYAQGRPYIPGNSYSRDNIKVTPILGNMIIWIGILPFIYLLLTIKADKK